MGVETFKAKVQYGDFRGTASADRSGEKDAEAWLEKKGLKKENEFLLGIRVFAGENHGAHKDPIYVTFLLTTEGNHDKLESTLKSLSQPINVRLVEEKMPVIEFFGLFKRLSICLSAHGMLDGREYHYSE